MCGRPKFDVDLLKSKTTYDDCRYVILWARNGWGSFLIIYYMSNALLTHGCFSENDAHIKLFWRCMYERFDDIERGKFLKFVWGQSRLPLRPQDFDRKFKIQRYNVSDSNPSKYLPISHTYVIYLYIRFLFVFLYLC